MFKIPTCPIPGVRPSSLRLRRPLAVLSLGLLAVVLAAPAEAGRAYVSNEDGGTVTVIDTGRMAVVGTVEVGKRPRGLALSPDGKRLYVAVSGLPKCPPILPDEECAKLVRDRKADGIAVVDTVALKLVRTLRGFTDPERVALNPAGTSLYITDEDAAQMTELTPRGRIQGTVAVGREPEGVRVSPDGRWVLVTSETGNTVTVIDANTRAVTHTVSVGRRPRDLGFTPDSSSAYVSGEGDASVYRVPLPQGEPAVKVAQLRKEARPMGVAVDGIARRIYVSTGHGGTIAVLSLQDGSLIGEVAVGGRPWGIGLSRDGRELVSANGPSGEVAVIDTATLTVRGRLNIGHGPWDAVFAP
ncbi:MAG: hypothetical protein JSR67_04445 [Proteobacteria bacterium]|nr:hypothetical protein [Pseudomonadota bacterium]